MPIHNVKSITMYEHYHRPAKRRDVPNWTERHLLAKLRLHEDSPWLCGAGLMLTNISTWSTNTCAQDTRGMASDVKVYCRRLWWRYIQPSFAKATDAALHYKHGLAELTHVG